MNKRRVSRLAQFALMTAAIAGPRATIAADYGQVIFDGKSPTEVSGILAGACADKGDRVVSVQPNEVLCEGELTGVKGAVAQLLYGSRGSTDPAVRWQFTFFSVGTGTRVQFRQYIETTSAFGQTRQEDVDNADSTYQTLQTLYKLGARSPNQSPPSQ